MKMRILLAILLALATSAEAQTRLDQGGTGNNLSPSAAGVVVKATATTTKLTTTTALNSTWVSFLSLASCRVLGVGSGGALECHDGDALIRPSDLDNFTSVTDCDALYTDVATDEFRCATFAGNGGLSTLGGTMSLRTDCTDGQIVIRDLTNNEWDCYTPTWGGSVSDGDKGDITVSSSGSNWQLDADVVGTAEIATDGVAAAEIAASAVGTSEIANGSVTPSDLDPFTSISDCDMMFTDVATDDFRCGSFSTTGGVESVGGTVMLRTDCVGGDVLVRDLVNNEWDCYAPTWGGSVSDGDKGDITVNTSGTNWQIDAGVVGTNEIGTDGVAADEIAAGAVGTSEIATDGVAAAEIAASAVGTSEINDGTVAFADVDNTITLAGNPAMTTGEAWFGTTGIVFEGSTATTNDNEGLLTVADPTADRTWTLPDETGTIITSAANNTITAGMLATDSVASAEIAASAVGTSEIADGVVRPSDLDPFTAVSDCDMMFTDVATDDFRCGSFSTTGGVESVGGTVMLRTDCTNSQVLTRDLTNNEWDCYTPIWLTDADKGDITVNTSGTNWQIDAGVVGTNEIGTDGVAADEIAAGAVGTSEIATDGVAAAEIAASAVGTSEINDGTVAFADVDNTITLAGNPAMTTGEAWFGTTGIIFEGSTATTNDNEGLLTVADPTADRTWTLPDETGTIITSAANNTITAGMLATDSVASAEIAASAVGTSEIADGVVRPSDLDPFTAVSDCDLMFTDVATDDFRCGSFSTTGGVESVGGTVMLRTDCSGGDVLVRDLVNNEWDCYTPIWLTDADKGDITVNTSGTNWQIDAGVVGTNEIGTDGVAADEIAAGAVGTSEIATDGVAAAEIAASAVGTSEINDGTVAFADVDNTVTLAGNPAMTTGEAWFGTTGIIFEGSTATTNDNEGLLTVADPTADRTWTLPNATGAVALKEYWVGVRDMSIAGTAGSGEADCGSNLTCRDKFVSSESQFLIETINIQDDSSSTGYFYYTSAPQVGWSASSISVKILWTTPKTVPAANNTSVFAVSCKCFDFSEQLQGSTGYGTAATISDDYGSTSPYYLAETDTTSVTCGNTCSDGDMVTIRVARDTNHASDDLVDTAMILGMTVAY